MNSAIWAQSAAVLYVVLSLGVLWFVFRWLRAAGRALAGGLGANSPLLGGNARTKLLGLAIAGLIFTPLITRLVRGVLTLFVSLADRLPRHLLAHWRTQVDLCSAAAGPGCLGDTLLVLAQATGAGFASAFRASGLLSIGFGYLVFMLALWAAATHALNAIFTQAEGVDDLDVRDLLLDENSKVTRQNFLFFLILFIGAYLSLASIAAIPDLRTDTDRGSVPTAFSSANLVQKLVKQQMKIGPGSERIPDPLALAGGVLYPDLDPPDPGRAGSRPDTGANENTPKTISRRGAVTPDTTANEPQPPEQPGNDGVAVPATRTDGTGPQDGRADSIPALPTPQATKNADPAAQPDSAKPATAGPRVNPAVPATNRIALQAQLYELRQVWGDRTASFDSTVYALERESTEIMFLAEAAYADADTTRRFHDQRTYFYRLQRWFLEVQSDLRGEYDVSRVEVLRLERRLRNWSTAAAGYLISDAPDPAQLEAVRQQGRRLSAEAALAEERAPRPRRPLPERGEGLGPFRYVSGWLLKTDSMPLTLIVGMMGFGLLGAAASTFVRDQTRRERRESAWLRRWQKEYAKRVRSESKKEAAANAAAKADAAQTNRPAQPLVLNLPSVVIRGGSAAIVVFLGIMGGLSVLTQEAEPNPYALLFTCLVGAVFSENVWKWAEKRFGLNLGEEDGDRSDDADEPGGKKEGDEGETVEDGNSPPRAREAPSRTGTPPKTPADPNPRTDRGPDTP